MSLKNRVKPRKSLRTILILSFLLFSLVPLAFITGFSIQNYKQAIDKELNQRLEGNIREIEGTLKDFAKLLGEQTKEHVRDKSLIYFSSQNNFDRVRENLKDRLLIGYAHRIYMFKRDGVLRVALFKDSEGGVQVLENMERGDVILNETLMTQVQKEGQLNFVRVDVDKEKTRKNAIEGQMEYSIYSPIESVSGVVVGYIEEAMHLDQSYVFKMKERMDVELFFFSDDSDKVFASHQDLVEYKRGFFKEQLNNDGKGYFDLNIRQTPYRFMLQKVRWGSADLYIGLGVSKSSSNSILKNVEQAFYFVVAIIMVIALFFSIFVSKLILRPLYHVLGAIRGADFERGVVKIETNNDTELGILCESFNEMSEKIYNAQSELKNKINQLEDANLEIKETQAKLVHTGKMASLGQLVAGVAHELNNPIGFIYSNMTHLREYSEKLVDLVGVAEKDPQHLKEAKEEADFEYMTEDLPRLISSCEDGARRTRDIVLGLRNFSRLEEAALKEVDIEEGLQNTLRLLSGELKNRIKVVEEFEGIPHVMCYPSQLNQVFMNILSNAAQAIDGDGTIYIRTKKIDSDRVQIEIEDTGKGMDEETRSKIFDPFFTTKSLGTGTGLGLSISYGVIEKHKGEIIVESEVGKGTKFILILPIEGPSD
ncbi:MAG: two-component sensor histidine kinase [Bdellovibrionales bacterium]|nr:two-component sensor histidine kinase [Bdellovibrionales bacterium]